MRAVVIAAPVLLAVAACGSSTAQDEGGPESLALEYLAAQAAAAEAVLDGDEAALAEVEEVNAEYVRSYTAEPGDPDGEWVEVNAWLADRAACVEELGDEELCAAVESLYVLSADLAYWHDEEAAAADEYWEEDRPSALDETREAVDTALDLTG